MVACGIPICSGLSEKAVVRAAVNTIIFFSQIRVRVVKTFKLIGSFRVRDMQASLNSMLGNWAFKPLFSLELETCNLCLKLEVLKLETWILVLVAWFMYFVA